MKRRRGGIAAGTAGFHSDVDRCQRAIKRISGLLECEISDSIVTLGILLLVLIYEGQQMKKGDDSKFGESLKFRCTYALEQHTRPLKQGWLKKQGEMGEAFKQRWFALFPDIWTYGQDSSKYGRIMAFYKSEPRSLDERISPKGAIMLSQGQYTVTLVGDQMRLVSVRLITSSPSLFTNRDRPPPDLFVARCPLLCCHVSLFSPVMVPLLLWLSCSPRAQQVCGSACGSELLVRILVYSGLF